MGTRVEQSSEFLPRASRTSRRHLEDMADSLHRLPSAAEDLQVIIPRCNRTLLLQGEFCITLIVFAEEVLAVAAAEEEGEAVQVGAECVESVGGVADVGQQRRGEGGGVGGEPAGDEREGL